MGCGCQGRQNLLNQLRPGLGDQVKDYIDSLRSKLSSSTSDGSSQDSSPIGEKPDEHSTD